MNILVLNGSPKKKSDTMVLTNAFLRGLNANGNHKVDIINVFEEKIAPCRGCFGCWQTGNGECLIKDKQNDILKLYVDANVIIWSFPLYCYGMPSHLKAVLDRTIPLIQKRAEIKEDGSTRHVSTVDFSKMHTVVISGCGFPNYEHNFEGLDLQVKNAFGNLTTVYVPETPLLNEPVTAAFAEPKIKAFEKAGQEYEKSLSLSESTVEKLQSLMIPKEEYMKAVLN